MRNLLILLLLSPLLTACLGTVDTGPGLDKISKGFSESMRWSDFTTAAGYVDPEVRGEFLEQFSEDDDLRIVESRILSIDMDRQEMQAKAVYSMEYYRLPSSRVKKWRWEQQWRLGETTLTKSGVWLIENGPPKLPWKQ